MACYVADKSLIISPGFGKEKKTETTQRGVTNYIRANVNLLQFPEFR